MIDLYYWTTPNGHKITMFLEEAGLDYRIVPVNIGKGEQFQPGFLKLSPNNRMPAIIDDDPAEKGPPVSVFESGAILQYLGEKTGKFLPKDLRGRFEVMQWLFWQMANLGPVSGHNNHFANYAVDKLPYAIKRFRDETNRLYAVMDKRLAGREYLAGAYSIADMACYPWTVPPDRYGQNLDDFPNMKRWWTTMQERPGVKRAYEVGTQYRGVPATDPEARKILFGQTAETVRRGA
jgi:GSH-dependent disulfide-bond oxidoreductase